MLASIYPVQVYDIYLTLFKDFKEFWPSLFTSQSVKCVYNFWKLRGIIDGFNGSLRYISSWVKKTADESICDIHFHDPPTGDLPHYSYIFRKPYPLGAHMKNVDCYSLGTMLHLDIQKGEGDINTSNFEKYIGGTAVCMKIVTMATKTGDNSHQIIPTLLISGSVE